ncbi:hypothetical protein JMF97_01010 [Micromonospora fiedleri]|uniref:Peptidase inhibitor family I36 n=1 Tax=Micromonospora fiedleri TaxID=1157498 RepID=A0ABS1UEG1_9ACTN|nr:MULTISPECIES: hypothetical protein [Micromonospora]MBL6274737.1 hypothetical protein [Micromonospora fiedleri]WSK44555.1 hypothetical protein OG712_10730 [Micromonospora maris]
MRVRQIIAAAMTGAAAVAIAAAPAQADRGDSKAACNKGEICFQWIYDNFSTSSYQRHFWYNDSNHGDDYWSNIPDLYPAFVIKDDAEGLWNRDTTCAVTIYDLANYATPYTTFPRDFRAAISPRNNSHKRCA